MNKKPIKTKEDFVYTLSRMTPQEINKLIEEKGKQPRAISFIIWSK